MAEAKPSRHVRSAEQIARDQVIKRCERIRRRDRRCRHREIELEWVAHHRRGLRKRTNLRRQAIKLSRDRGADRGRHLARDPSTPVQTTPGSGSGRVPAAEDRTDCRRSPDTAAPDRSARHLAHQPRRLIAIERPELELLDGPPACGIRRLPPTSAGDRSGPDCRGEHHGRVGRAPEQVADELHRRTVAPLKVIEREQQRPRRRQTLEQLPRRKVSPEALRRGPRG